MAQQQEQLPLFPVEFALRVVGRGLTALCCFPDPKKAAIQVGDPVDFVRPDKSVLRTSVRAISMVMDVQPGLIGLVLPDDVRKEDLPPGTALRLIPM